MQFDYEQEIAAYAERVYGGDMPAHNRGMLRKTLEREDRRWGEMCERDYQPSDEGMHWSDNK